MLENSWRFFFKHYPKQFSTFFTKSIFVSAEVKRLIACRRSASCLLPQVTSGHGSRVFSLLTRYTLSMLTQIISLDLSLRPFPCQCLSKFFEMPVDNMYIHRECISLKQNWRVEMSNCWMNSSEYSPYKKDIYSLLELVHCIHTV